MFALNENQIDALQCFATGLLSVTDTALRLKEDAINIVALTENLDADLMYLIRSGEEETLHIPCVGSGSNQYLMQLSRPNGNDVETLIVNISYTPSTIKA
jgi:hypothetical protein